MIATIILALGIAAAVFFGLKSFVKGKGSCGDPKFQVEISHP